MNELLVFHKFFVVLIDTIALWLVLIVVLNNRKKVESWLFAMMSLFMFGWVNFAYLARIVESSNLSVILLKIAWFVTPWFFMFIYYFSLSLLKIEKKYKWLTILNTLLTLNFSVITLSTNWVIKSRKIVNGSLAINYGFMMWPFLISVMISIVSVAFLFLKHKNKLKQKDRKRLQPFVLGLIAFYTLNFIFNITLPIFFSITRYYYFGDYATIILNSLIAYSIFRHNFLGTKVFLSTFTISVIGMLLIIDIFVLSDSPNEILLKSMIFVFYIFMAIFLQRSILLEQKQKEQLKKLNLQLSTKAKEQQDMMDVLAHEVKTPISSMLLEAEFLENNIKKIVNEKDNKIAKSIIDSVNALQRAGLQGINIVNGLLEFTRINNNRFHLNYSQFDLIELTKHSIELLKKTVNKQNYTIKFKPSISKLIIEADQSRIQEAIEGLLINAKKYGVNPKTGHADITVQVKKEDDMAIISVSDNGMGLTPQDKKSLGQKFYRGVNQKRRTKSDLPQPGGTGLGLFMINIIMDAHKGHLSFDSPGEGKGSVFRLHIPLKQKNKKKPIINTRLWHDQGCSP
jgi:signal transduction histidine kinase